MGAYRARESRARSAEGLAEKSAEEPTGRTTEYSVE
jgi:hypothetical protein